jgi:hypothetical protein
MRMRISNTLGGASNGAVDAAVHGTVDIAVNAVDVAVIDSYSGS